MAEYSQKYLDKLSQFTLMYSNWAYDAGPNPLSWRKKDKSHLQTVKHQCPCTPKQFALGIISYFCPCLILETV